MALATIKNALRPNRARSLTPRIKDRLRTGNSGRNWTVAINTKKESILSIFVLDVPSFLSILFVLNVGRYKT